MWKKLVFSYSIMYFVTWSRIIVRLNHDVDDR